MDKPLEKQTPLKFLQSVRGQTLALLSVVLLVTLLIVSGSVFAFVFITEQQAWQGRQSEATQRASESIAHFLQRGRDVFAIVNTGVGYEEGERLQALLDEMLELNPAFQEILLINPDGDVSANSYRDNSVLGNLFTVSQSFWFLRANSGEEYLSAIQFTAHAIMSRHKNLPPSMNGSA